MLRQAVRPRLDTGWCRGPQFVHAVQQDVHAGKERSRHHSGFVVVLHAVGAGAVNDAGLPLARVELGADRD